MSITLHALPSPNPSILNIKFTRLSLIPAQLRSHLAPFSFSLTKLQSFNPVSTNNCHGFSRKRSELLLRTKPRVWVAAKDDDGDGVDDEGEKEARGESTFPQHFRYFDIRSSRPSLEMAMVCRLVKQRGDVSSALPMAALLTAVGEPWVRFLAMASYFGFSYLSPFKKIPKGKEDEVVAVRKLPLPLLGVALAIGIHVAARWACYQHLTWMVV